jgi:tetratricopeptide (TPR) repeat protein
LCRAGVYPPPQVYPPPPSEGKTSRVGVLIAAFLALGVLTTGWFWLAEFEHAQGLNLGHQGYLNSALIDIEAAADLASISSDLWVDVGKTAEGQADASHDTIGLSRAAEFYERAIAACPSEPAGYIGAARSLREAGRFDDALRWAQAGSEIYPKGPAALMEYARCLEAKGDVPHALEVYRTVMALADEDFGKYVSLEGWADYHIAEAASAVARASTSPDERLKAWGTAGRITAMWLQWNLTYKASLEVGGQADSGRMNEMVSLAMDASSALAKTGQAGDDAVVAKLRKLAQRATGGR